MKFRKKPVVVEAFKFDGDLMGTDGDYYVPDWAVSALRQGILFFDSESPLDPPCELFIRTLEGNMMTNIGDWVIQGVNGELYPCKPDIFEKTYEPAYNEHPDCYSPEKDNPYPLCVGMFSAIPSFLKKKPVPFEKCKKCNLFVDFDERDLCD